MNTQAQEIVELNKKNFLLASSKAASLAIDDEQDSEKGISTYFFKDWSYVEFDGTFAKAYTVYKQVRR